MAKGSKRSIAKLVAPLHSFLSEFVRLLIGNDKYLLSGGVILGLLVFLAVLLYPYSQYFFIFWLIALMTVGLYFFKNKSASQPMFDRKDLLILVALVLVFSPWYLSSLATNPVQIHPDELTIVNSALHVADQDSPRLFYMDVQHYNSQLHFIFYLLPSYVLGGINLEHMRFVVASVGLGSVAALYLLFRLLMPRFEASVGAIILGTSHVYVGYSRMVLGNNMAVLLTILAVFFFLRGWLRKDYWSLYVGGIIAGLGWYTYFVGRFIILLVLVFFGLHLLTHRFHVNWNILLRFGTVTFIGFLLVLLPLLAASTRISEDKLVFGGADYSNNYIKKQTLLFPEGRERQKNLAGVDTDLEAFTANVRNGLRIFNGDDHRQFRGSLYINPSGRFLDVLTGILLWVGLVVVMLRSYTSPVTIFFVGGFFFLWFIFSTIIIPPPFIARYVIFFPFVAYFATQGLFFLSDKISQMLSGNKLALRTILVLVFLLAIVFLNVKHHNDSVAYDSETGNEFGGIYRDIVSRTAGDHTFFIGTYPNASIGEYLNTFPPDQWQRMLKRHVKEDQRLVALDFSQPLMLENVGPATLYTHRLYFESVRDHLEQIYAVTSIRPLTPTRDIIAVELR